MRAGSAVFGVLVIVSVNSVGTARAGNRAVYLVAAAIALIVGVAGPTVLWAVTRWRVQDDMLQVETGLIRRQSIRIPLQRIQAVDVVAPLLARMLGLAEVRVVSAGRGGEKGRLMYLGAERATAVRARLLALAHGMAAETPEAPAWPVLSVPFGRLVTSLLLRGPGMLALLLMLATVVIVVEEPRLLPALGALFPLFFAIGAAMWREINIEANFTILEGPDGLRLHRGLLQTNNETIPYGRIQAVRWVEPVFWRWLGWCRLEVDVAHQRERNRGQGNQRQLSRSLVPVASREHAAWLLSRVLPGAAIEPPPGSSVPGRAFWRAPLASRFAATWHDQRYVAARTGRVRPATVIIPMVKVQSVRSRQGPWARALHLASVHVDSAGRRWQADAHYRDADEAAQLVETHAALAQRARAAEVR